MIALARTIAAHEGAFEFDWRARFHLPLSVIGKSMSWGEAVRLTLELVRDPSSRVCAALGGWEHATTHDALMLMNLYDLVHQIAFGFAGGKGPAPKPHPRPWPLSDRRRIGPDKSVLTQDDVIAALRSAGHLGPLPPGYENDGGE